MNRRSTNWNRHALWTGLVLLPFFLRGTSLPLPIPQAYLFYGCYASVAVVSVFLILTRSSRLRLVVVLMVLTTVPSLFQETVGQESILRWVAWLVVVAAVGPLVAGPEVGRYRKQLWDAVRWTSLGVCCASFVVWTVGDLAMSLSGRGAFYGVMSHSMILAPIAALTTIDCLYRYMRERERQWLLLMAVAVIDLLLSGSRGATLGCLVGSLWMVLNTGGSMRRYGVVGFASVLVVLMLLDGPVLSRQSAAATRTPRDSTFTQVLRSKGIRDSRTRLWRARLREFNDNKMTGIGFARTRYGRISRDGDFIEPGSSYLAILSMTGLAGGVGWLILVGAFGATWVRGAVCVPKLDRSLVGAVAAFFGVHLAFEGYIYAPGSLVGLIFYTWLAMAWDRAEQGARKRGMAADRMPTAIACRTKVLR